MLLEKLTIHLEKIKFYLHFSPIKKRVDFKSHMLNTKQNYKSSKQTYNFYNGKGLTKQDSKPRNKQQKFLTNCQCTHWPSLKEVNLVITTKMFLPISRFSSLKNIHICPKMFIVVFFETIKKWRWSLYSKGIL